VNGEVYPEERRALNATLATQLQGVSDGSVGMPSNHTDMRTFACARFCAHYIVATGYEGACFEKGVAAGTALVQSRCYQTWNQQMANCVDGPNDDGDGQYLRRSGCVQAAVDARTGTRDGSLGGDPGVGSEFFKGDIASIGGTRTGSVVGYAFRIGMSSVQYAEYEEQILATDDS
jgi:hypothetical protein